MKLVTAGAVGMLRQVRLPTYEVHGEDDIG